jgi:hypothetical protein
MTAARARQRHDSNYAKLLAAIVSARILIVRIFPSEPEDYERNTKNALHRTQKGRQMLVAGLALPAPCWAGTYVRINY